MFTKYNMPRLLSTNRMSILHHILIYIFIPNSSLNIFNPFSLKCFIQSHIGHYCSHHSVLSQVRPILHVCSTYIHYKVSIYNITIFIYCQTSICISVVSKSHIQIIFYYKILQITHMSGSTVPIDISSVRLTVNYIGFSSDSIKYTFGYRGCRTICQIKSYPFTSKRSSSQGNKISYISISSYSIIYSLSYVLSFC